MKPTLQRTRDGRMLCQTHATTGAPSFHTPGCDACEAARAKGIVRPDIGTVPKRKRGRMSRREKWIEWDKIKPENRAGMAAGEVTACLDCAHSR